MGDDPDDQGSPDLHVTLLDEQDVAVDAARLAAVARSVAAAEGAVGEISLLLVPAGRMAELHVEHMGEPGPTDVLSFPVDGLVTEPPAPGAPPVLVGEVVVCPAVALAQAGAGGGPPAVPTQAGAGPPVGLARAGAGPLVGLAQAGAGPGASVDPADIAGELDLLVAHGVLHLLGHDHDTREGAARMREREQRHAGRAGARAG